MTTAVALAGHGSHVAPETAAAVWRQVDALRAAGAADEVTACFWKEPPSFARVADALAADTVFVVPVFAARGFYSQSVLPAELAAASTRKRIVATPLLAEHPFLLRMVRQRLDEAAAELAAPDTELAVALIGHGTPQHPESRRQVERWAAEIQAERPGLQVVPAFLDDQPDIPSVFARTSRPKLIAVPCFIALGSHVAQDVPRELGLPNGARRDTVQSRDVLFTPPVGAGIGLTAALLELLAFAGAPPPTPSSDPGAGFPQVGAKELVAEVQRTGGLDFGELRLEPGVVRRLGDTSPLRTLDTPAELRTVVRGQSTAFRKLPTALGLPGGWRVDCADPRRLPAVVETVYPGSVADWHAGRQGMLETTALEAFAARQIGMYRPLGTLPVADRQAVAGQVCATCVRTPTWLTGDPGAIPCLEPCNLWLTAAVGRTPA